MQPGMIFSYHGWDPMQYRTGENFSAVICTAGLIKPTTMAGDYGHLGYRAAGLRAEPDLPGLHLRLRQGGPGHGPEGRRHDGRRTSRRRCGAAAGARPPAPGAA